VGETLDCLIAIGAVLGGGTLDSNFDIAPRAFAPTRGEVRPPRACFHLPPDDDVAVAAGTGEVEREDDFACPAAGVDGAR